MVACVSLSSSTRELRFDWRCFGKETLWIDKVREVRDVEILSREGESESSNVETACSDFSGRPRVSTCCPKWVSGVTSDSS